MFGNCGEFFTWECSGFFPPLRLEIGDFHSCMVNSDEGKDWLGRVESKHV